MSLPRRNWDSSGPNRFAAIGMVGAALLLPSTWCKSTQPVPMIGIHGLRDPWRHITEALNERRDSHRHNEIALRRTRENEGK
jgi:poly(3-hydroxybutyrate) depolymerase